MSRATTSAVAARPRQAGVVNAANALTFLRLALVPLFVWQLFEGGFWWRVAAFSTFMIASATDRIDGELARRRGLVTDFGKIADPIADKALIGSALVGLSVLHELAWPVTLVILGRELGVTVLRLSVLRHGVIPASRGGKAKTVLQVFAIGAYVLPLNWPTGRVLLMGAAVIVTVVTGLDYAVRAWRLRRIGDGT
ncbi:MAG: CDP-diacylglycerol--glycerol-3-phosphate 3-phosphatidyltransferase [Streptosporangiales bacterium]|nr:CDP-diacylglycerol--glycerol-3-phosphate 3-phosphatidyltransferase [Streptosporangiales bacterium]